MTTPRNGDPGGSRPVHRNRLAGLPGRPFGSASHPSGRRLVIATLLGVLALWGGLYAAFRRWRAGYRLRAAFGASRVAPAIEPMASVVPPGVDPGAWRGAVAETRALLRDLTASNLLDYEQMEALRAEVAARAARAKPETALGELAGLWDDLEARSVPALRERHPRPGLLRAGKAGR